MFHNLSTKIQERMKFLEGQNRKEKNGEVRIELFDKLRQVPPETGRFISIIAASTPEGQWIEIGTSGGYSTLWLALAARRLNKKLTTFELDLKKIALANETFTDTELSHLIDLVPGNILDHLSNYKRVSFCFLDTEKKLCPSCYDIVIPNMVPGAILLVDNAISHQAELQTMIDRAFVDERVASVIVPIGEGILMCKKL